MAYADLAAALQGDIPSLSYLLALQHIKRAYRDILDAREWGFLIAEDSYILPTQVTTGLVAITQSSLDITPDATALAAILAGWPTSVSLNGAQIRFNGSALYTLIQSSTTPWQIDRPVAEATTAASPYQLYQAYITAPTDFKRWDALVDVENGYTIAGEALRVQQSDLDRRDPQRQSADQAYCLAGISPDSNNIPRYELWPHPTGGQTFLAHYRRKGLGFAVRTDVQPAVIPDALILQRAYGWYTYPWAAANSARLPGLGGPKVPWMNLILEAKQSYNGLSGRPGLFALAVRDDEAQTTQRVWNRGHGIRGSANQQPIGDAAYWQRHPIPF